VRRPGCCCAGSGKLAEITDLIRRGLDYEDPAVFAAVRRALGLTQSELGLRLGMAPDNTDDDARRRNVGRTIRRYEAKGAPVYIALALRWLAACEGLLEISVAAAGESA
jgi:hypothetical protein